MVVACINRGAGVPISKVFIQNCMAFKEVLVCENWIMVHINHIDKKVES